MAETSKTAKGGMGETVRVVVHALLIALVIRTFLFQPFNIPSDVYKRQVYFERPTLFNATMQGFLAEIGWE